MRSRRHGHRAVPGHVQGAPERKQGRRIAALAPSGSTGRRLSRSARCPEHLSGNRERTSHRGSNRIATNRREELEMTVLCLRILQAALVYINTLMLQDVLAEPAWAKLLSPADRRGLTPLFWQHVQPYGEVRLDVAKRLPLGGASQAPAAGNPD
ncbi:Tn3 family transposase [Microbispora sp. CA-102843]|uniref:Tn3 family transposase n=1 Tax=Microbispora sp. CA-102843 TaxID=3239952 RepID=UPI003D909105